MILLISPATCPWKLNCFFPPFQAWGKIVTCSPRTGCQLASGSTCGLVKWTESRFVQTKFSKMCVALFSCLRRRLTFQSSRGSCTAPPGFFHKEPRSEQAAVLYSQHIDFIREKRPGEISLSVLRTAVRTKAILARENVPRRSAFVQPANHLPSLAGGVVNGAVFHCTVLAIHSPFLIYSYA